MIKRFTYVLMVTAAIFIANNLFTDTTFAYSKSNQISDSVFYNYKSMSQNQINNFIKSFSKSCLLPKNYPSKLSTVTFKEPLNYYDYGADASPARIIWKASQYYKLNPQVILTTLEKENNFISGNGGCAAWRYNSAMGYDCTESNSQVDYPKLKIYNTCVGHETNAGFSRQVNHAAWQLSFDGKRANGDLSWMGDGGSSYGGRMTKGWRARTNGGKKIYYDGYTTINGQSVYLGNGPTAALYNYTPHFTNFDSIFTKWFGSTHYKTKGAIGAKYLKSGETTGPLGTPVMNEHCGLLQKGCYQSFQNGASIYWTSSSGAWIVKRGIRAKWTAIGRERSYLRYPTSDENKTSDGAYQDYQRGQIYWSNKLGKAQSTHGAIGGRYKAIGANASYYGYPKTSETKLSSGAYQQFENGRIYWSRNTDAWGIHGAIGTKYISLGGSTSYLGYPADNEKKTENGITYQQFEKGRIYWSRNTDAWGIHGAIGTKYISLGGSTSYLGLPTTGEFKTTNGVYQDFEGGRMFWSKKTGAWGVRDDIKSHYGEKGFNNGLLGYPTGRQGTLTNGIYQQFENGRIYFSESTGAQIVHGGIQTKYLSIGGSESDLRLPKSEEIKKSNETYQNFQNGTITWKNGEAIVNYIN